MRRTTWAVVALALVVGGALAVAGLLLAVVTLASCGGTAWLLVRAWSAEPLPGSLPSAAAAVGPEPSPSDVERMREVASVARRLPRHLVADADTVERVTRMPSPSAGRGVARFVEELGEGVGR